MHRSGHRGAVGHLRPEALAGMRSGASVIGALYLSTGVAAFHGGVRFLARRQRSLVAMTRHRRQEMLRTVRRRAPWLGSQCQGIGRPHSWSLASPSIPRLDDGREHMGFRRVVGCWRWEGMGQSRQGITRTQRARRSSRAVRSRKKADRYSTAVRPMMPASRGPTREPNSNAALSARLYQAR